MGKYLKEFELTSDYNIYMQSERLILPNVSLTNDDNIVHYNPIIGDSDIDYAQQYLTFEALENGEFMFVWEDIQYSKDNGNTWTTLPAYEALQVVTGDKIMWKLNTTPSPVGIGRFYASNDLNVSGNIMSVLYGDDFIGQTSLEGKDYAFQDLFVDLNCLIDASNLILPATTLSIGCYYDMFNGCYKMTTAPKLPATTLTSECYSNMFNGCSSLNHITMLATDISAHKCLTDWVWNVSSTGTFYKNPEMTSLPTGISGIPEGWTVVDYAA